MAIAIKLEQIKTTYPKQNIQAIHTSDITLKTTPNVIPCLKPKTELENIQAISYVTISDRYDNRFEAITNGTCLEENRTRVADATPANWKALKSQLEKGTLP
ncbi:MAG: hypothetical protein VKJ06_06060 [Vampirovibrionales bacterium]|nr:hypothetical protein [Vampirovibrionales bacterium]